MCVYLVEPCFMGAWCTNLLGVLLGQQLVFIGFVASCKLVIIELFVINKLFQL